MPLYEYACECGKRTDEFRSVAERNNGPLCCGKPMLKQLGGHRVVPDVAPYYDDNLQSYVKSKQHRARVMREQGVTEKFGRGWM
jgi:predicted nucleic acid-binding Zn ribbon protein